MEDVPFILRPGEGTMVSFGGFTARFMIDGDGSDGAFAMVEHTIAPRTIAAPLHTHANEDEFTLVLEGEVGFQIGDQVAYANEGELVAKRRGIPHAFWNRQAEPARVVELIAPPAFAAYFKEIEPLLPPNAPEPDVAGLREVQARYGLEMDFESIQDIAEREGLPVPG